MNDGEMQGVRPNPYDRILQLIRSDIMRAAQKYIVAGGICALVDWGLFALFLYVLDLHYVLSGGVSFLLATALNYVLSVHFVFGASRRGARSAMALVYFVSAVGLAINLCVLSVGVDILGLHPMLMKMAASAIALFWNFLARYFYIFR